MEKETRKQATNGRIGGHLYAQKIVYPFSHNHGSADNYPNWKETHIGDTPIFHEKPWLWEEWYILKGVDLQTGFMSRQSECMSRCN